MRPDVSRASSGSSPTAAVGALSGTVNDIHVNLTNAELVVSEILHRLGIPEQKPNGQAAPAGPPSLLDAASGALTRMQELLGNLNVITSAL